MLHQLPLDEPSAAAERLPDDPVARAFRAYSSDASAVFAGSQRWAGPGTRTHTHQGVRGGWHRSSVRSGPPSAARDQFVRIFNQPVLPHRQEQLVPEHELTNQDVAPSVLDLSVYRDSHGLIAMCVACRRVQRPGTDQWDEVPELEQAPLDEITGGLCVPCFERHLARYSASQSEQVA